MGRRLPEPLIAIRILQNWADRTLAASEASSFLWKNRKRLGKFVASKAVVAFSKWSKGELPCHNL